ncbi:hypothetical protein pneo_cds_538 [Pandoravirus neocaledonia]|uniref:Uncharacterized protein n=1 Tax=Pandoravirus neocaledonia TaxID=2107708 RepID=A0A2U7UCR1_9VIRU|nr:hypothetical protein pneo_cds_538 [Pandoravirus neocaledonia]AVK76145.1 hypothetical protein pneo_cds_538 [Pandoravirus neocaledonia]
MDPPPFETFEPKLPRRAAALRAAMIFVRTADADALDGRQAETCKYWCDPNGTAQFYECQDIVQKSAKLRGTGLTEATAEIVDDVSWYYKRYGACRIDGFDVRARGRTALRASRVPLARTPTYTGVVDVEATGRIPKE